MESPCSCILYRLMYGRKRTDPSFIVPVRCSASKVKEILPSLKLGFSPKSGVHFVKEFGILSREQSKYRDYCRDISLRNATLHLDNIAGSLSQQTCKQAADRAGICRTAPG
jgi:hypothetical protein